MMATVQAYPTPEARADLAKRMLAVRNGTKCTAADRELLERPVREAGEAVD